MADELIGGLTVAQLRELVSHDAFWSATLATALAPGPAPVSLHLAVLVEPYLGAILAGQKTIESRFAQQRRAPYGQAAGGDIVLLKRSGGPILGLAMISQAQDYALTSGVLQELQAAYATPLYAQDPAFWAARAGTRYATLLWLDHVLPITPLRIARRDRRGWVVLRRRAEG